MYNSWDKITVEIYKELDIKVEDFNSVLEWKLELVSILYDIDVYSEEFDDKPIEEFDKYLDGIKAITNNIPSTKIKQEINGYKLKPFKKLTFGEYIDLDYFAKESLIQNLNIICAILYKKDNEEYEYDVFERAKEFDDVLINDVFGIMKEYKNHRDKDSAVYKSIFPKAEKEEDDDDDDELTGQDKKIADIEKKKEEQKNQFAWEFLLNKLSNGDITKEETILNMPYVYIFNKLTFLDLFK